MRFPILQALLVFVAGPLVAQSTQSGLSGTVRQEGTKRPLAGVQVLIEGTDRQATTDSAGRFQIAGLAPGYGSALIRLPGYRAVRLLFGLNPGQTLETETSLMAAAVQLDPIVVRAELPAARGLGVEGFEERRRMGFGKFIDSTVLRRSEHLRVSDVLRRAEAGFRLINMRNSYGVTSLYAASTRKFSLPKAAGPGELVKPGPCWMQVVLDGSVLYSSGSNRPLPDFLHDFDVSALEAIEVYRSGAETPIEFSGPGADCGTIVLWSHLGAYSGPKSGSWLRGEWQVFLGAHGGVSLATLTGAGATGFGNRRRAGPQGGVFLDLWFREHFAISPELLVTTKGIKTLGAGGTSQVRLTYLEVPVLLKALLPTGRGPNRVILMAGPAFSKRIGCGGGTTGQNPQRFQCEELLLTRTTDLGVILGGSFETGRLFFTARYDIGLASLNISREEEGAVRTRAFSLLTGIKLRLDAP